MKSAYAFLILLSCLVTSFQGHAAEMLTVHQVVIRDEKAVFATVESANVVPARARIGGTVAELAVRDGDYIERGTVVAVVGDEKIAIRISALDSKVAGIDAEVSRAKAELDRLKILVPRGTAPATALEVAQRDYNVAVNAKKSASSDRDVLRKQISEGQVLAPVTGRILKVPVTAGTVVMMGETLAMIAEGNFILRLEVPERHARFIKLNDPVRLDPPEVGAKSVVAGKITLVYPQIENGRIIADASVEGLGDYFVGKRVRAWISGDERKAFIVPSKYISTRFGIDYVRVKSKGGVDEVPVQRGEIHTEGVEILSGLKDGDTLLMP